MTQFQNDFRMLRAYMPYKAADSISYSVDAIEAISRALQNADKPMRCKEIAAIAETDHRQWTVGEDGKMGWLPCMNYQKIAAALRKMLREGLVERAPMGEELVEMGDNSGKYEKCEIYGYCLKR